MAIMSMTGFARSEGGFDGTSWTWELRSVNAKGLDIRTKLYGGYERLEAEVRARIAKAVKRGNLGVSLSVVRSAGPGAYRVNRTLLDELVALSKELQTVHGLNPASPDGLLAVRGVMESVEAVEDDAARSAREAAMLADFDTALAALRDMRAREGAVLAEILDGHITTIAELAERAAGCAAARPEALKARLEKQVREVLDAGAGIDADRLAQEAALLATKADIREEIDRLGAHVGAARALTAKGGAIGRRFDFLCQEFNREANTLCSKANDAALTAIGLDLKAAIDQLREQIQNIE